MKQRRMTIAAVACGLACALCVAAFLLSVQGEADAARAEVLARYGGEQVQACVATRDIAAGERLDGAAVEAKLWIADLLPEDAISEPGRAVGRTATSSILKGEVVVEKRFAETQGLLDVPRGMEAVSVPAKTVQAVGGAIRAGMSIDVYSSGSSGTSPLARGVLVLATSAGESGSISAGDSGWITLAVDPEKVEEIIAASGKTSLYFALPGGAPEASPSDGASKGASSKASAKAKAGDAEGATGDAEGAGEAGDAGGTGGTEGTEGALESAGPSDGAE